MLSNGLTEDWHVRVQPQKKSCLYPSLSLPLPPLKQSLQVNIVIPHILTEPGANRGNLEVMADTESQLLQKELIGNCWGVTGTVVIPQPGRGESNEMLHTPVLINTVSQVSVHVREHARQRRIDKRGHLLRLASSSRGGKAKRVWKCVCGGETESPEH